MGIHGHVLVVRRGEVVQRLEENRHPITGDGQRTWRDRDVGSCCEVAIAVACHEGLKACEFIACCCASTAIGGLDYSPVVLDADVVHEELLAANLQFLDIACEHHRARLISRVSRGRDRHGHTRCHCCWHGLQFTCEQGVAIDLKVLDTGSIKEDEADLVHIRECGHVVDRHDVAGGQDLSGPHGG